MIKRKKIAPRIKRERAVRPPPRKIGVVDAVNEAWSEIESLKEEMEQWRDNIEERFSATDKFQRIEECIGTLEDGSEPTEPNGFNLNTQVNVTIQDPKPQRRGTSRADRLGQAVYVLDQCIDALTTQYEAVEKSNTDYAKALEEYRDECQELKDNVENAEFPGMFG